MRSYMIMFSSQYTLRQMLRIVWVVGWSDFVLKYRGSALGYLWSLLSPLAKFLVIYYVFRPLIGGAIARYPLYLFLGIIVWEHFTVTTTHCMTALREKACFIMKIPFPRLLIMLTVGWTNMIVFLTHFLIFTAIVVATGGTYFPHWAYIPVILVQMTLLALGVGMLLASYSLRYGDLLHLWGIFCQVLFWLTPIMYAYNLDAPISQQREIIAQALRNPSLHALFDVFVRFQPLSLLIYDLRRVALYGATMTFPSLAHATGLTAALGVLSIGTGWLFVRRSRHFIQEY